MRGSLQTKRLSVQQRRSGGFISIAVLWLLGAVSVLVSVYAVYVINTASAFGVYDQQLKRDALISAALELTAYRQLTTPPLARPIQGSFDFRLGGADIDVQFRSEAARIDLNAAPRQLLAGLFTTLGAPAEQAKDYANLIIAWRTPPSAANASGGPESRLTSVEYRPRGGKFRHPNELSLVRGLPMSLIERALPFVTAYSGRPQVNILAAAPEIIASLPDMSQDQVKAFLLQRDASNGDAKQLLPANAQQYTTVEGGSVYRVSVRVSFDDGSTDSAEVAILIFDAGDQPFAVLAWQNQSLMADKRR